MVLYLNSFIRYTISHPFLCASVQLVVYADKYYVFSFYIYIRKQSLKDIKGVITSHKQKQNGQFNGQIKHPINFYLSFVSRVDFARLLYQNKHDFIIHTKCIELRQGKMKQLCLNTFSDKVSRNFTVSFSPQHILKIAILGGYSRRQMVILVSEASNRYTHLFLVEREYVGFHTLGSVIVE